MPVDIHVYGVGQLEEIGRRLKESGDKQLRKDLYRGLTRAAKPMVAAVKADTDHFLPHAYALEVSKSLKVRTRAKPTARNPAIFLVGSAKTKRGKKRDLGSLNRGRLRHPLFGDREHWYDQRVSPRWWEDPLVSSAPLVRRQIVEVLDDVARRLARG